PSTYVAMKTMLWPTSGWPVRSVKGVEIGVTPAMCSENASTPDAGTNIGAFHQAVVSGTACVPDHHRNHVVSSGSPGSCGTPFSLAASGHVYATATAVY